MCLVQKCIHLVSPEKVIFQVMQVPVEKFLGRTSWNWPGRAKEVGGGGGFPPPFLRDWNQDLFFGLRRILLGILDSSLVQIVRIQGRWL